MNKENRAQEDFLVKEGQSAHLVHQDCAVKQVAQEKMDLLDHLDQKAHLDIKDHLGW